MELEEEEEMWDMVDSPCIMPEMGLLEVERVLGICHMGR
jgi:hypothetical protein